MVGTIEDDTSVEFDIGVTPTKPGKHVINGVFRFGFHNGGPAQHDLDPADHDREGTE